MAVLVFIKMKGVCLLVGGCIFVSDFHNRADVLVLYEKNVVFGIRRQRHYLQVKNVVPTHIGLYDMHRTQQFHEYMKKC